MIREIESRIAESGFDIVSFAPNLVIALVILLSGMIIGKFSKWVLKKIFLSLLHFDNLFKQEFIEKLLTLIKWIIYIVFLQAAIRALKVPGLSDYLAQGLAIIPQVIGGVIIVIVGYAIAVFFREGLKSTEKENFSTLGDILHIFVLYISLSLGILTAFISTEIGTDVVLVITLVGMIAMTWFIKKNKK